MAKKDESVEAVDSQLEEPPPLAVPETSNDDIVSVNTEVSRLVGLVQTQQDTIDYLVQYIERVEAQLNDRVDAMEMAGPAAPSAPAPSAAPTTIDWSSVSGPRRLKAWHDLSDFVEGLVGRFSIQLEVLPCWWQHGDAVEELTALWQARNVAFAPTADASMASWWQDLLERSRHRLRSIFSSCRDGHVPVRHAIWMNDEIRDAMEDAVKAEVEAFG